MPEYVIQVSEDGSAWTTVYSTASGDGGNDAISFGSTLARYVRMESTAWSSGSLRVWLREFEVYTGGGSPPPTSTPTPTPAPTATATPTPPGGGTTMHVGDLDGSSSPGSRSRWNATVAITVHDADENAVAGATVNGTWSNGASGSGSCVTDATGKCNITKDNVKGNVSSVSFGVDSLAHASISYQPGSNHDPDGDSNGTDILVLKP